MNDVNVEQLMILLNSVDDSTCVRYSRSSGKFYVVIKIEKLADKNWSNVVAHADTVDNAIIECYRSIQGLPIRSTVSTNVYTLPVLV